MSLASCLPIEVLCNIFVLSLPRTGYYLTPKPQSSPMLLTRICRLWREVSEDMPSLWCRQSIRLDDANMQQSVFCYDSWLKRTQGHSLSLKIVCFRYSCTSLQPLLQPYADQISSLDLTIGSPREYKIILNDLDLPALQELRVDIRDSSNFERYFSLLTISPPISQLTTLRTLEFKGMTELDFDSIPVLNPIWAHLSNVTLDSYEQDALMRLLRLAPNLSSLKICSLVSFNFRLEPLTHTKIQSLSIGTAGRVVQHYLTCTGQSLQDAVATFLNALTLPNLRVLEVDARSCTGEELKGVTNCKDNWNMQSEAPSRVARRPWPPIFPYRSPHEASVYFIPSTQDSLPQSSAIVGGHESNGDLLHIVRAPYAGGIYPGKASQKQCVYISHDGKEINIQGKFERLVGDQSCVRWAHVDGRFYYKNLDGSFPVRAGRTEPPVEPLYIAQASVEGGVHCGTVKFDSYAAIPLNGFEIIAESYDVLVYL